MVDRKITELTEAADLTGEELLVVVDDPASAPVTKKATLAAVRKPVLPLELASSDLRADLAGWDKTRVLRVGGDLSQPGTATPGTATEFQVTGQAIVHPTASPTSYEKAAAYFNVRTHDPSDGLTVLRDAVGIDTRGVVAGDNALGRAWGLYSRGEIHAGGDGLIYGAEIAVANAGTDQPAVSTTTSKYGIHLVVQDGTGLTDATAAVVLNRGGARAWHKGIYASDAVIGTGANDSFLELYSDTLAAPRFAVRQNGRLIVETSSQITAQFKDVGATGVRLQLIGNGATTPSKYLRVQSGSFQILSDAATAILTLTDTGGLTLVGGMTLGGGLTLPEGGNVVTGTTSGARLAATATQKLGFWGQQPRVRPTGWEALTGTASRTTVDTTTVTTAQLAERVKALVDDLTSVGLIGA